MCNGREAGPASNAKLFDLLLLDIHMPNWTACEVVGQIRRMSERREATCPSSP